MVGRKYGLSTTLLVSLERGNSTMTKYAGTIMIDMFVNTTVGERRDEGAACIEVAIRLVAAKTLPGAAIGRAGSRTQFRLSAGSCSWLI